MEESVSLAVNSVLANITPCPNGILAEFYRRLESLLSPSNIQFSSQNWKSRLSFDGWGVTDRLTFLTLTRKNVARVIKARI